MPLTRREHFELPELWRRFLEPVFEGTTMRVEEFVDGSTLVLRAELPGLDPENDVELTITDGVLDIRAHRHEKTEEKGKEGFRSEFRYGSLYRSMTLPAGTQEEDVKASYVNGILEVRVPIGDASKSATTRVPVALG